MCMCMCVCMCVSECNDVVEVLSFVCGEFGLVGTWNLEAELFPARQWKCKVSERRVMRPNACGITYKIN